MLVNLRETFEENQISLGKDSEGVKELQSEGDMEQEMSSEKDEDSESEEEDEAEEDEEEMAKMQDRGDLRDVEVWNGFISGAGLAAEEEALLDWKPGDPVTPQYVLRLPGYTDGEDTSLFVCNTALLLQYFVSVLLLFVHRLPVLPRRQHLQY